MERSTQGTGTGLLLLGLALALGLVASSLIVSGSLERIKLANQKITVKGFAEQTVTSDVGVWRGRVIARADALEAAYEKLTRDMSAVHAYLVDKGVPAGEMTLSSVSTQTRYKTTPQGHRSGEIKGYELQQTVEINSGNVALLAELSRSSTSLIRDGIEFLSFPPAYYASAFDRIKVGLIGEATRNARERAEQFAANSGVGVGRLKSATQGVFQVTPLHSTEISSYGLYDTSTIEKSVKAVVTIEYAIRED